MNKLIKIRPAPNGKFYAVWRGRPLCDADGRLRYFADKDEVLAFVERCDAADRMGGLPLEPSSLIDDAVPAHRGSTPDRGPAAPPTGS